MALQEQTFAATVHLPAFDAELRAAGIMPDLLQATASTVYLRWAGDAPVSAVEAVLAAHNPATRSVIEQQEAAAALDLSEYADQYQQMLQARATIDSHMDAILAGPASPTAAQTGTALKTIAGDILKLTEGMERLLKAVRVLAARQA
jgi:hypothetical protein